MPVAIHFDLFDVLVHHGAPITVDEVMTACNARIQARDPREPQLCTWNSCALNY